MQNGNGLTSKTIFSDAIDVAARWLAVFGGIVLLSILVMVSISISLRALGMMPIQGDFELLQVGLAIVVGSFLPWCHGHGGNMFVDFVTKTLPIRRQCQLDALAGLLVFVMLSIIAWRSGAGAIASKASGEITMIRGFPIWISYALMVPGLTLTAIVALDVGVRKWMDSRSV